MTTENTFIEPFQVEYINNVATTIPTGTKGMNAGIAHEVTVLENSILLHVASMLHEPGGIVRRTELHNETGFAGLVGQVKKRDKLLEGDRYDMH